MRLHRIARLAIALVALGWVGPLAAAVQPLGGQDIYRQGGQWQDDRGRAFQLDALYGTPTVITMAYGACRRICSASLRMMEQLQVLADAQHKVLNFVVVGIDPRADRPQDWAAYRAEHKLTRANWVFLSGEESSVRLLARRLGVHHWRYGEHTMHELRIVLLSPQAQALRSVDAFDEDIATLLP